MFKKILVPLGFSRQDDRALEIAGDLARHHQAQIVLFHIVETIEHIDFKEMEDFYHKLEKHAQKELEKAGNSLKKFEIPVQAKVVFGKRAEGVVKFAMENEVDLIVLSSHKIDVDNANLREIGTISYRVGVFAPCPVLLVK